MSLLASVALLSLTALVPQGDPPAAGAQGGANTQGGRAPLLAAAEQASLRQKLAKYLEASDVYDKAVGLKDREKAGKGREKAKEDFDSEWERFGKKGNLLGSMADLRAVFDNCFLVKPPTFSLGQLRKETLKEDGTEYSFFLPKTYKADKPTRAVVVLPGAIAKDNLSSWTKVPDYFAATWDKSAAQNDTIFHVCHLPDKLEMDLIPDFTRDNAEAEEQRRIQAVFSGLGQTLNSLNVDRSRVFLDCARGNCGFGIRFVSMFPDRFAGIVLREPVAVDDIRLGTLLGMPVLMVKTAETAAAVDALKARLEAQTPNSVTVVDATDAYPHKAAAPEIEKWMAGQRRNMSPRKVVIEPNHDRFNRAYWVDMDRVAPLTTSAPDQKPRIEVEADRENNRIVVKARGVDSFILYLNDDLVDLDREFVVVVNDKAVSQKLTRSFRGMHERLVQRRDWDYLFPVVFNGTVPK